jgi:hypothetical protein
MVVLCPLLSDWLILVIMLFYESVLNIIWLLIGLAEVKAHIEGRSTN